MVHPFWGRGGRRVSDGTILKERWRFSRLSIVTIALSLTIRPQFAVDVSDSQIIRGWVTLEQNLWRKGLTDVVKSGRDLRLSFAKEIVSLSSAV